MCHLVDVMQHNIYFFGTQEPLTEYLMRKLTPVGGVVIDIGANIGLMSVVAGLRAGCGGIIVAVEPARMNAQRLRENLRMNGIRGVVVDKCIWYEDDGLNLEFPPLTKNHWGAARVTDSGRTGFQSTVATTLDGLVEELNLKRIDLIKIDVEGSEVAVIRGGGETLRRYRPPVIVEVNIDSSKRLGFDSVELFQQLTGIGYRCWAIGERFCPSETPENFKEIHRSNEMPECDNLCFSASPMDGVFGDYLRLY